MSKVLLILFLTCSSLPLWALEIPTGLDGEDRRNLINLLGIPTSTKYLTNPYPLGGYTGFEVGLSYIVLNTVEVAKLGNTVESEEDFTLAEITIGKGLFNDIDLFLHFSPFDNSGDIHTYGGFVKWSFYQAKFLPINFSMLISGNTLKAGDSFVNQTLGVELLSGINVDDFALYCGVGRLNAEADFMGGTGSDSIVAPSDTGLDPTTNTIKEKLSREHVFIGLSIHLSNMFVAAQIDRYENPILSGKLGLRF